MGVSSSEKVVQVEGGGEDLEGKTWVITGISVRVHLRPINTNPSEKSKEINEEDQELLPTTPKAEEARLPESLPCPPAPKKRKPTSKLCHFNGVREFFSPPDLESVFLPRVERAK